MRVKDYESIARDILRQVAEGIVTDEFVYRPLETRYTLSLKAEEILDVTGVLRGEGHSFSRGVDYMVSERQVLTWLPGGERPDPGTKFTVRYRYLYSSRLTDTRPGSVLRNLVEAFGREMERLYMELRDAYYAGFIDTAEGEALDLVVALLGIKRKPPQNAVGKVVFGRSSEPETMLIQGEVHLYDGSSLYRLRNELVKRVIKVYGVADGEQRVFTEGVDYAVSGGTLLWLEGGGKPDLKTIFRVDYEAYRKIVVPKGVKVTTYSRVPEEVRVYETIAEDYLKPTPDGRWEAEIPVRCTVPGSWGNVLAGSLTVMPQPPMGVEYVVNKEDIYTGVDAEPDEELRERAKHALDYAGRATLTAIEAAVRSVEGVRTLKIVDMPGGVPGLIRIVVDGGDEERLLEAIESTRAAGVRAELVRPTVTHVDVTLTLVLDGGVEPPRIIREVEARVRSYVSKLGIGEPLLYVKLIHSSLVEGVKDVAEVVVKAYRGGEVTSIKNGNLVAGGEELISLRNVAVLYRVVGGE